MGLHIRKWQAKNMQKTGSDYAITKTGLFKYTENFTTKNEIFQIKNSDILHISAQTIDCGSNEYPQSMFLSRNKKMYTPVLLYKSGV